MNLGEQLAKILLEQDKQTIALFPGAFKPPHKGHVDVVKKLLDKADQVVVLVSPKMRDGVSAEESVAVWNLYKKLFDGPVEVRISANDSPVGEVYDVVKNNLDTDFIVAFGKGEESRYAKMADQPNATVFDGGTIEGANATNLRMAIASNNTEEIAKYLPTGVTVEEFLTAISEKPIEKPAEEIPAEPAPEAPLQESPPVDDMNDDYYNYVESNRDKIEKIAQVFNYPIDDMLLAFQGGKPVVMSDDMWSALENSESHKIKDLEAAIAHALKLGINPRPYIDQIKKKKEMPLPLVLQYSPGKFYLVGGEVVLSILKALGAIPEVLIGNITPKTQTLPEPIFENLFGSKIQNSIKEDIEYYGMISEYQINLGDVYDYKKENNFYNFYDEVNNSNVVVKLKPNSDLVEFKFYPVNKDGKVLGFSKLKHYNPKVMNTVFKIFLNEILPNYNKVLIQPAGNIRYRLFRALLNNKLSKQDYDIVVKDEIDQPYIIVNKKESAQGKLNESQTATLGEFIKYAIKNLNIQKPPSGLTVSYDTNAARERSSFGTFNPENDKIWLYVGNRNMADILRTLAHELVHRKQHEDGRINYESGETGSEIENEANAQAGILLRNFGKLNKQIYQ